MSQLFQNNVISHATTELTRTVFFCFSFVFQLYVAFCFLVSTSVINCLEKWKDSSSKWPVICRVMEVTPHTLGHCVRSMLCFFRIETSMKAMHRIRHLNCPALLGSITWPRRISFGCLVVISAEWTNDSSFMVSTAIFGGSGWYVKSSPPTGWLWLLICLYVSVSVSVWFFLWRYRPMVDDVLSLPIIFVCLSVCLVLNTNRYSSSPYQQSQRNRSSRWSLHKTLSSCRCRWQNTTR